MGFSPTIKTQALVAAARHCCVCHRYRGLKIEVHHIVQEADGGPNTLDNAIAVCFDCHTDAGHYNRHHPKGSKFSPDELRLARDRWHDLVRTNNTQEPTDGTDELHVQYLVCRAGWVSRNIIQGDLHEIPGTSAFLIDNEILESFKKHLTLEDALNIDKSTWGDAFPDVHVYLSRYPDAKPTDRYNADDPYFETNRIPALHELDTLSKDGSLISILLKSGLTPADFLKVVTYPDHCGGGEDLYTETLLVRSLWTVYLHISNMSESPLRLDQLEGSCFDNTDHAMFLVNVAADLKRYSFALPAVSILPKQTVLVPVMLLLAPMKNLSDHGTPLASIQSPESTIALSLNHMQAAQDEFITLGAYVLPEQITYQTGATKKTAAIHTLDLARTYTLDRHWQIGSCPHLFFEDDGGLRYVRELFTRFPNEISTEVIDIPDGVTKMTIAELEDEETVIDILQVNGIIMYTSLRLHTGDSLSLDVSKGDRILITGRYLTTNSKQTLDGTLYRNTLIGQFMNNNYERKLVGME